MPTIFGALTSPTLFSTPTNPPWCFLSHNWQGRVTQLVITSPFACTNMVVLVIGATWEEMGWVGGCNATKCYYSSKAKLKIHVKQLRSITYSKIHLQILSKSTNIMVLLMQNPHGPFLFIHIEFFHTRWIKVLNHVWASIPKCM